MRILLADDHAILRSGLKRMLEEEFRGARVGEAASLAETREQVRGNAWDLLVLDVSMGGQNGLDLLPELKTLRPELPILILSMHAERPFVIRALRAGASAYVTKEHAPAELMRAVRAVAAGRRYVGESIAGHIADHLALDRGENPHEALSPREYEIFLALATARSVSEIAEQLRISVKTVSTHRTRILEKMALRSNAEVMQYAIRRGLVT